MNGECIGNAPVGLDAALSKDWLVRWDKNILSDARNHYCDRELGKEADWLVSPFQRLLLRLPSDARSDSYAGAFHIILPKLATQA